MSEIADRYRRLAADFTRLVQAVPEARWERPSPCPDWTAREIVRHMTQTPAIFFGLIGREFPPGPSVDDDPMAAWAHARGAVQAALDDPDVAGAEFESPSFGRTTFERSVDRFLGTDLVIHGWDLARAAGLDERMDPDEVHRIFEAMKPMDDVRRAPGACGPRLEPPAGADEQTRLLAFLGRRA
jgi:uncharacterized protein (TIGR03086 family)